MKVGLNEVFFNFPMNQTFVVYIACVMLFIFGRQDRVTLAVLAFHEGTFPWSQRYIVIRTTSHRTVCPTSRLT